MPLLSLCMIVRNEEANLAQCLSSVKPLVDEIIIVDTGSTDETKAIAAKFTPNLFDFTWCDDFAAARNWSLMYAQGDWILVLDADEVLSPRDFPYLQGLITSAPQDVSGFTLLQRNYIKSRKDLDYGSVAGFHVRESGQSEDGFISAKDDPYAESQSTVGWLPVPIVRLFRNEPRVRFAGIIHEDVTPSLKGRVVTTSIPIHHYGKMDVETWKSKWAVYEKLAEKKAAQEKDYYAYFELGRQYLANQKIEEAQKMFLKSILLNDQYWLSWFNLGSLHLLQNNLPTAIEYLHKARELNPTAIAIYKNLGVVYAKNKEFDKAIKHFVLALHFDPTQADVYKNLGLCYTELGDPQRAYLSFKKAIEYNPDYATEISFGKEGTEEEKENIMKDTNKP